MEVRKTGSSGSLAGAWEISLGAIVRVHVATVPGGGLDRQSATTLSFVVSQTAVQGDAPVAVAVVLYRRGHQCGDGRRKTRDRSAEWGKHRAGLLSFCTLRLPHPGDIVITREVPDPTHPYRTLNGLV